MSKREVARSKAIEYLNKFLLKEVSEDEYNLAVAEYADVLREIHASEATHVEKGCDNG